MEQKRKRGYHQQKKENKGLGGKWGSVFQRGQSQTRENDRGGAREPEKAIMEKAYRGLQIFQQRQF